MTKTSHSDVVALYIDPRGPYPALLGADNCWDAERDARLYDGPWPVVAHPPCERWGRYWHGGPSVRVRRVKGDDGGCFAAALQAVRSFGGVLEHPEASHAWAAFGLRKPPKSGGWIDAGDGFGRTCCVEQGHYGHAARKATWLYACVPGELPEPTWGPATTRARLDHGYHSKEERAATSATRGPALGKRLTKAECVHTPVAFAEWLIALARSVEPR